VILTIIFSFDRDMGCHIDGFIAVVAHTHVITNGPVTGRAADVLAAANTAAEVAMRLVRPGKKVQSFTSYIFSIMMLSAPRHILYAFSVHGLIFVPSI